MGVVKDATNEVEKTGLLGYNKGQQSLFLDAETGGAIFGKTSKGQILIDPNSDKSLLYSHNYWKSTNYDSKGFPISTDDSNTDNITGEGLLIDLSTPTIKYGDGSKFEVDKDGNITCGTMLTSKGILVNLLAEQDWDFVGVGGTSSFDSSGSIIYTNTGLANFICQIYIPENFIVERAYLTLFELPVSYRGNGTGVGYIRNSLAFKAKKYDESASGYVLSAYDSSTYSTTTTSRQSFTEYSLATIGAFSTPSGAYGADQNIETKTIDFSSNWLSKIGTNNTAGFWEFTAGYSSNPAPSSDSNYWNIMKYTAYMKGYISIQGYYVLK
jgi:hypothetical protein